MAATPEQSVGGPVLNFHSMLQKTTAWQASKMQRFFYVYVLVSETTRRFIIRASPRISKPDWLNTIKDFARPPQNIVRGESRRSWRSTPRPKPVRSRNI